MGVAMMQASGILFLSKTPPVASKSLGDVFSLTMLAYDRIGTHKVEPWRIIFSGPAASEFWSSHQADLKPGQPIYIEAEHMRIAALKEPRVSEFQVHAMHMALAPVARSKSTEQPDHCTH